MIANTFLHQIMHKVITKASKVSPILFAFHFRRLVLQICSKSYPRHQFLCRSEFSTATTEDSIELPTDLISRAEALGYSSNCEKLEVFDSNGPNGPTSAVAFADQDSPRFERNSPLEMHIQPNRFRIAAKPKDSAPPPSPIVGAAKFVTNVPSFLKCPLFPISTLAMGRVSTTQAEDPSIPPNICWSLRGGASPSAAFLSVKISWFSKFSNFRYLIVTCCMTRSCIKLIIKERSMRLGKNLRSRNFLTYWANWKINWLKILTGPTFYLRIKVFFRLNYLAIHRRQYYISTRCSPRWHFNEKFNTKNKQIVIIFSDHWTLKSASMLLQKYL